MWEAIVYVLLVGATYFKFAADAKEHKIGEEKHFMGVMEWFCLVSPFLIAYFI